MLSVLVMMDRIDPYGGGKNLDRIEWYGLHASVIQELCTRSAKLILWYDRSIESRLRKNNIIDTGWKIVDLPGPARIARGLEARPFDLRGRAIMRRQFVAGDIVEENGSSQVTNFGGLLGMRTTTQDSD